MKRTNKKGFTIVELVIVIAVIAVLAAVLVPTFSNLINKANTSADMQLVKNLNTMLASEEAFGNSPETMHDAILIAKSNGYLVENLTPTGADNNILWYQTANRFVLMEGEEFTFSDENTVKLDALTSDYHLWKIIATDETISNTFSNYLADGYPETAEIAAVTGVDVGFNTVDFEITYNHTAQDEASGYKDVIIRTNSEGTSLTIDAKFDSVVRHGSVDNVTIIAIKGQSYHEKGLVNGYLSIAQGRAVLESGSTVAALNIAGSAVEVVIADDAQLLNKNVTVDSTVTSETPIADILAKVDVPESVKDEVNVVIGDEIGARYFAGGEGTEAYPYLIATDEHLMNFNNDEIQGYMSIEGNEYYFKLINDVSIATNNYLSRIQGVFDGDNHSITAKYAPCLFYGNCYDATIQNLTIKNADEKIRPLIYDINGSGSKYEMQGKVVLKNVTTASANDIIHTVAGNNQGAFTWNIMGDVTFENCTNNLNFVVASASYAGVFVGGYVRGSNYPTTLKFINCVNNGTITGGMYVGFFSGNDAQSAGQNTQEGILLVKDKNFVNTNGKKASFYIENCRNNGLLSATRVCHPIVTQSNFKGTLEANAEIIANGSFIPGTMMVASVKDMTLYNDNNQLAINASTDGNVNSYKVIYYIGVSFYRVNGTSIGTSYLRIEKDIALSAVGQKIDFISAVMLDVDYDVIAVEGQKYADLAKTGQMTDVLGNEYVLATANDGSKIVVIHSAQATANYHSEAVTMKVGSKLNYSIVVKNEQGVDIGANFYTYDQLKAQ